MMKRRHSSPQPAPLFKPITNGFVTSDRFKLKQTFSKVEIILPEIRDVFWVTTLVDSLLDYFRSGENIKDCDRVGLCIETDSNPTRPIFVGLRQNKDLTSDVVLDRFFKVLQSNDKFFLRGVFNVKFTHVSMPEGRGLGQRRGKGQKLTRDLWLTSNRSVQRCDTLPNALVLAKAYVDGDMIKYETLRSDKKRLSEEVHTLLGEEADQGVGRLQKKLHDYRIVIFQESAADIRDEKNVMFEGGEAGLHKGKTIYLFFSGGEYDVILSCKGTFKRSYFCDYCLKGFSQKDKHRCKYSCKKCLTTPRCDTDVMEVVCGTCNRLFYGEDCLKKHLSNFLFSNKRNVCDAVKKCTAVCKKEYTLRKPKDTHSCRPTMPDSRARIKGELRRQWIARMKKNGGVVEIEGVDYCLSRALAAGVVYCETGQRVFNMEDIDQRARSIRENAGVLTDRCGYAELAKFQDTLLEYGIAVSADTRGDNIYYKGPNFKTKEKKIFLTLLEEHYDLVINPKVAFGYKYYCEDCAKGYTNKHEHQCAANPRCNACRTPGQCDVVAEKHCVLCNRVFPSEDCFENHKLPGAVFPKNRSVCEVYKKCPTCLLFYSLERRKKDEMHVCGERKCAICKAWVPYDHLCYIQPLKMTKKARKVVKYAFFDIETRQDETVDGCSGMWQHIPILIVAQVACSKCLAMSEDYICPTCGRDGSHTVFDDEKSCIKMFLEYLHSLKSAKVKSVVVCSHNGGSYDLIFVLKEILVERALTPQEKLQVISNGNKIIKIDYKSLKFIDTINYFMCPLRKLPKVFNLDRASKGYFPFLFARKDNKDYVGPLPDEKYYLPDGMSETEYGIFKKWYDTEKREIGDMFDIKAEMLKYCKNDVTILRRASCTFENDFYKETGVYPLKNCVTIASACMDSYRSSYYPPCSIGVIPQGGYRLVNRHSQISLEWLEWRARIEGVCIKHAGNGHEKKIGCYRVDGYTKKPDGEEKIYEFLGCYHHGHRCMEGDTARNTLLFKHTMARINHIKSMGYKVTYIWGCQYEEEKKTNENLQRFLESYDPTVFTAPLNPRDAFFGGHTCAFRTHHKAAEGESIRYFDFMSLYPYINKYGVYPLGHPNVYLGDSDAGCPPLKDVFGLIKCTVVPPRNLFFPVIPFRSDDEKLLFALCRTCAVDQNQFSCSHESEADRAFSGTWCSPELHAAMDRGYKVL